MELRRATPEDAAFLLALRNDPAVRAASRSTGEVAVEEHRAWLARTLADPGRHLLIVESGDGPAGQVRLDRDGQAWEISIALMAGARGGGAGTATIDAAVAWLRAAGLSGAVHAAVRPQNAPSLRAFKRAGFVPRGEPRDGFQLLVRE